ncbi:MAG TPA: ABC transporter ATP-binding protein [Methanomassiliicoccales archaeon]|nr:ABC transporter ATP-binding protein [Methanomassiliicoccales archaeon]
MAEEESLLAVEGLYTNFYTYQGVVKALDGISFDLKKGETFGLVGETGCGKSVTANCILRLIPQPPGKIESGHIYFLMPGGTDKEIADAEAKLSEAKAETKRKDPAHIRRLETDLAELKEVRQLREEIQGIKRTPGVSEDDPRLKDLNTKLDKIGAKYDLLQKSDGFMRKIRGKYISMIFQEPMSALNPVFPAGDQIAEVLLVHERRELAQAVVRKMERDLKEISSFKRVERTRTVKGEYQCKNCSALMAEEVDKCPQCGGSFVADPLRGLRRISIRYDRRYYNRMLKKQDDILLRVASKIPLIRRYERPIKIEALERAEHMLRLVRIPDPKNVVTSYPHELSGGMQQRVMIAMALACKPQLLIADEPTTALDVTIQAQILKLMRDLQEETQTAILIITHNLGVVAETCDRVGVMYAGVMAEIGPVGSIFKEPLHPYTQGLMNAIPSLASQSERLEAIEGNVPNLIKPPAGCRFHPRCPYAMGVCRKEKPKLVEVRPGHFTTCHLYGGVMG